VGFPDGAMLTGWIVALILSPHQPWYVAAVTAVVGVASKYAARVGNANVFNPAALALVATFYVFGTGQSWWGALPEITPLALTALFATGVFITRRVNKLPAVLAFLGCYYLLFTLTAFIGDPRRVAAIYRAPDLHAALFFAFFMVTDPPTSPPKTARPVDVWCDRWRRELCFLRAGRRGVLSSRWTACRQRVGSGASLARACAANDSRGRRVILSAILEVILSREATKGSLSIQGFYGRGAKAILSLRRPAKASRGSSQKTATDPHGSSPWIFRASRP
jgi:hypothetical protein